MAVLLKAWAELPNAGDVFSVLVTEHVCGETVVVTGEAPLRSPNVVGLGSILHWADAWSTVWGSGFVDERVRCHAPPRAAAAVRGPLSARRLMELGGPEPMSLGDPGALAPAIFPRAPTSAALGIVPHYVDGAHPWVMRMGAAGARVIDPLSPLRFYMAALTGCEWIVASSLHGLVFAHAYGIPAAWVRLSDRVHGDGFKFRDYLASVGLTARSGPAQGAPPHVQPVLDPSAGMAAAVAACRLPQRPVDADALCETLRNALRNQDPSTCHSRS